MSREQKQALALELRRGGWSLRRIEEAIGVKHGTVRNWFAATERLGAPSEVENILHFTPRTVPWRHFCGLCELCAEGGHPAGALR